MPPGRFIIIITAPVLVTSALLLAVGTTAAWYVHRINQEVTESLARNLECTIAGERLVAGIRDARIQMHQFIDTRDESHLQAVAALRQSTRQDLADAARSATTDDIRALIRRTQQQHAAFFARFAVLEREDLSSDERQQQARELTQAITNDLLSPAQELLDRTQQAAAETNEGNQSAADSIGLALLLLGTCGAVGGLMAGYGIARGAAQRIEQSEREATRSEQLAAVGQMAAGLAHELRNPLMAMRVLVEAGREQAEESEAGLDARDLQVLDEEIERLEKLVGSFLDFARPPKLEMGTVWAQALVEQTLHLVRGPARQRGVQLHWEPPRRPLAIDADPVQMRQVLLNLLLNAFDAAGEGGQVWLRVAAMGEESELPLHNRSLPRDCVAIQVADTGPGVPPELQEKIFEPFISSKETGLGLGLAVSKRIMEAHGGWLMVGDRPGGGACFTACLPAPRAVGTRAAEQTAASSAPLPCPDRFAAP